MKTPTRVTESGFCFWRWQFGEVAFFKLGVLIYTFWVLSAEIVAKSVTSYTFAGG